MILGATEARNKSRPCPASGIRSSRSHLRGSGTAETLSAMLRMVFKDNQNWMVSDERIPWATSRAGYRSKS